VCDIPVTAVFLRSRMAHCYWFLEALRVFEACIVMEYDICALNFQNVLFGLDLSLYHITVTYSYSTFCL